MRMWATGAKDLAGLGSKRSGFIKALKDAERPMIIILARALWRVKTAQQVLRAAGELADKIGAVKDGWNGFQRAADRREPCRRSGYRLRAG
jgi:NADH-quinone oxidoreductase subunit G